MKAPKQQDLMDVPQCLRELADAIEADPNNTGISAVVLVREQPSPVLTVFGFGKGEEYSEQAFTECHIAATQLLRAMTGG